MFNELFALRPCRGGRVHLAIIATLVGAAFSTSGCTLLLDPSEYLNGNADSGVTDSGLPDSSEPVSCGTAVDCADGLFCNGDETCDPAAAGADAYGCVAGSNPCPELCDDASDQCVATCPSGTVAVLGQCRSSCGTIGECATGEVCVEGACLPSAIACGGCAEGVCSSATLCRVAAGECDVAEYCDGSTTVCPGDGFRPDTDVCHASTGDCDPAEYCTGNSAACPADVLYDSSHVCRIAAGDCDAAEYCTGTTVHCPSDARRGPGSECRASAGICDLPEVCDGLSVDCPADLVRPNSYVCRSATGVCDLADKCDGLSAQCPMDAVVPSGTTCRAGSGDVCDPDEVCDGLNTACPTDVVATSAYACHPAADACDPAEYCPGVAKAACPTDTTTLSCPGSTTCDPGTVDCRLSDAGTNLPLIFVTSVTAGALPIAESDALCQARADAVKLGGTFVALLSSDTVAAKDRVVDRAYYRPDGVLVASSAAAFFDGTISAVPNRTELNGDLGSAPYSVRTGSKADGTANYHCNGWTTTSSMVGMTSGLTNDPAKWLAVGQNACNYTGHRLYCIQTD